MESATRIFEALADRYEWTLITNKESSFTRRWRQQGARIRIALLDDGHPPPRKMLDRGRWALAIAGEVLSGDVGVVHVNDIRAYQASWLPVKLIGKVPLLFTIRDTKAEDEPYGRHWRRAARQCERIITLSDEMRDVISRRVGVSASRLCTINSIVDLDRFRPVGTEERRVLRAQHGIEPGEFAVGIVGAIQEKKEQLALIERALPRLLGEVPSVRIHFLGDFAPDRNAYARKCLEAVRRLDISDRVHFHGHTDNVAKWYPSFDCVVVASRREGLARCMIEAMSCGTPVVSVAVCSAREMLDGTGAGLVVPLGDYAALGAAVAALAGDRAQAEAIGRKGRAVAEERFDRTRIAAEFGRLYDEVIDGV